MSLGVSALLHIVLIVLYPALLIQAPTYSPRFGPTGTPLIPEGTELVNLVELPEEPAEEAPAPQEEEDEPAAVQLPGEEVQGEPGEEVATPGDAPGAPTAAERLRPRAGDLRLWAPVDPEIVKLSDEEVMRLLLLDALENASDSAALAEELARRALDWTYTDDEGRRWGVSPEGLHLGDVTLPLPGFSASPWSREQNADRIWAWDDIERGAARKAVRDSWKERAEVIRRRREAERRPDTTGVHR